MDMTETNDAMKALRNDLAELRNDLRNLKSDARTYAESKAREGMGAVTDRADRAMGAARDAAGQVQDVHDNLEDTIRRHPTVAVLLAAGVGALAAKLFSGSRK
jgi:ElaB/YqjD/DUF883 family membrane-anchored ribosome-binding protein